MNHKMSIHIHTDTSRRDSKPIRFLNRRTSNVFEDITKITLDTKLNQQQSIQQQHQQQQLAKDLTITEEHELSV